MKILSGFNKLNNKAQTLVELMITVGIGSFVALAMASVFVFAVEQFNILTQTNRAQENLLLASYQLKNIVSQAVRTEVVNAIPNPIARGAVLATHDSSTDPDNTPVLLAMFQRETALSGTSDLKPGAIFFVPPLHTAGDENTSSGKLVFDLDATPGHVYTSNQAASTLIFQNISALNWTATAVSGTIPSPAQKVVVNLTARSFKSTDTSKWLWFGTPAVGFSDYKMTVEINLRDNDLTYPYQAPAPGYKPTLLYGGVYFYRLQQ